MKITVPSKREEIVLRAMWEIIGGEEDGTVTFFKYILGNIPASAGLTIPQVRRTVRALARKGYTEYVTGLVDDDGMLAGSGYALTESGHAYISHCDLCWKRNRYEYKVDENGETIFTLDKGARLVKECEEHYKQSAAKPQQEKIL